MTETIRQLYERKSVRAFEDKEIPQEAKSAILRAAAEAPTAGNQQLYTILDITDQELKDKLAVTCDNQPFIAKAKMVLIFCADCQKWYDAYINTGCEPRKPGVGDLLLAVSDANIAAQNAVVAAWSLGIGSCYIGDVMENCEKHREMLNLPEYVFPCAMLVFGYPTQQQAQREKPRRFQSSDIVHENGYQPDKAGRMEEMLMERGSARTPEELSDWISRFCARKWNSDFSVEMSRSCQEMIRRWCMDESE